ncbi:MAG: hypothetical protein GX202_00285 [Firmicutes bacterium]|nr:hypothetical protein [Bacillota bacterium]
MVKKHPGFYLVFLILFQILLIFSLPLLAQGAVPPEDPPTFSGRFTLVDADGNGTPDHLGYFLPLPASRPDVVWVCGELQAMIDQQWRTIDYTARPFTQTSGAEAALYFYGGELRRLRVNGPYRVLIEIRGVSLHASGTGGVSAPFQYGQFEAADTVLTNQGPFSTAQIQQVIYTWANENGIQLGPIQTVTFTFDRWRFDFAGGNGGYGKRIWYAPTGEINWTIY